MSARVGKSCTKGQDGRRCTNGICNRTGDGRVLITPPQGISGLSYPEIRNFSTEQGGVPYDCGLRVARTMANKATSKGGDESME